MQLIIWNVKGYKGYQFTKKMLGNEKWSFNELIEIKPKIKNGIEKCLENDGEVFVLTKKNNLKAVYLFKLINEDDEKVLVLDKKIILEEVKDCVSEFEDDLETVLGETLAQRTDISKVIWRDKEIEPVRIKIGKLEISVSLIWILVGIAFWIMFDSFIWFIIYFGFAISCGYAVNVNSKRKNNNEKQKGEK